MYAASKAAATHLGKQFAIELGPRNITTNIVAPGFFPSKLANGLIENLGGKKALEEGNPRKRLGLPEDIAGVMLYLCGPAASYVCVHIFSSQPFVLCHGYLDLRTDIP